MATVRSGVYTTGFCGTGQHEVCRLRWSGPCACPCGHVAPAEAAPVVELVQPRQPSLFEEDAA